MPELILTVNKNLPDDETSDFVDRRNGDCHLFYVIPTRLIEAVQRFVPNAISEASYEFELEMASRKSGAVALRDGLPVNYLRLAEFNVPYIPGDLATDADNVMANAGPILSDIFEWSQAYLGWLVQQTGFQSDIELLHGSRCDQCSPFGVPPPYPADNDQRYDGLFRRNTKRLSATCARSGDLRVLQLLTCHNRLPRISLNVALATKTPEMVGRLRLYQTPIH